MKFAGQAQAILSGERGSESRSSRRQGRHALPHEAIGFVCTGNICRSAYAESALRTVLADGGGLSKPEVVSVGISAVVGSEMEGQMANEFASRYGTRPKHTGRQIDDLFVDGSTLILTMTHQHRRDMVRRYPQAASKSFLLTEFLAIMWHRDTGVPRGRGFLSEIVRYAHGHRTVAGGSAVDIEDPYQKSEAVHYEVAEQLTLCIAELSSALGYRDEL